MDGSKTNATWDDRLLTNPHAAPNKRARVRQMFAAIAPCYDLNNRVHSFWQDQRWRRKAVKLSNLKATDVVVDVACGTGDLTLAFHDALVHLAAPLARRMPRAVGIDFTYEMLPIARSKSDVQYINGDAQSLPLADRSADVVSIAFGIRNVQDPVAALREFYRVLRPGGRVIILEFSLPTNRALRALYNFYFRKILPRTATWISRDKTGAYKYLPESVNTFITRQRMIEMMRDADFEHVEQFPMTFGVCVCYRGVKVVARAPK